MSAKNFEQSLMDMICAGFAKEGTEWSLVKAGEDGQLPINHIVQFIEGKFFYISLLEFITGGITISYTVRITDSEPKVDDNMVKFGNLFIDVVWGQSDKNVFYLKEYSFRSCGSSSLNGESADFLQSIFSRLVKFTSS